MGDSVENNVFDELQKLNYNTIRCKSQENTVFIAIHPTTYRSGRFLTHGVLKE